MSQPAGGRDDRTWLYVALAFVVFWGLYLTLFAPGRLSSGPPLLGPALGSGPADYSWRLLDLKNTPVEFSQFKGKVVFLNIWATWCGPCVGEMPSIARLAANPRLKDVAFLCVSTDDSAGAVTQFLKGKDWPMTVLRATDLPPVFATEGIPATFIIAPDGHIATAEVGAATWDDPSVINFLEKLVGVQKPDADSAPSSRSAEDRGHNANRDQGEQKPER